MLAIFERRRRDARGSWATVSLWAGAAGDVLACAARVHLDILRQDLRYLGRSLRRTPGFALSVVVVAALGVGATTAAFSITDHVLIRPLPFPGAERLVQLWQEERLDPGSRIELSPANLRDWQRLSTSFEAMGAFHRESVNLVGDGEPERLETAAVSSEVVPLLGTRPLLGRTFAPDEDREGAPGTLLLSYGLWHGRFGGDPGVLGRRLLLDHQPYQVIGVMPRGFYFPRRETRLWRTLRLESAAFESRDDHWLETVARLRPGVSLGANESLLLGAAGGLLGILLALAALPLVARLVPNALPIAQAPPLDLRILGFAALMTLVTAVGFGLAPALRSLGDKGAVGLREGACAGTSGRERLRSLLVVAEVTVAVVLLISSGLLIRALLRVQSIDPGFEAASVLLDVRTLPGVTSAAYTSFLPFVMGGGIWTIEAEGQGARPEQGRAASVRYLTPDYLETLGIPLRKGRDVAESDTASGPQVAVVSESFVERYWPGQDPIGRRFRFGLLGNSPISVIGAFQDRSGDPGALVPALRRIIARADPQQPVADVRTLETIVETQTAPRRVQVWVLSAFAAVAVLLAGIGIHGLLAFTVASRSQEIGVRRALGARTADILSLVVRHGLRLAGAGVGLGLLLAYAAGQSLEALLAGVSPRDHVTFTAAAGVALAAALAGSLLPAWRALRVDPLKVMRVE